MASEPSTTDQVLFEYGEIRKEILQNEMLAMQALIAMLVVSSSIMTIAFSDIITNDQGWQRALLFFGAGLIAYLSLWQNSQHIEGNFRLGSYLAVFLEPHLPGVKWETRLQLYGDKVPGKIDAFTRQRLANTSLIAVNFVLGNLYFYWYSQEQDDEVLLWSVPLASLLVVVGLGILWVRRYVRSRDRARYTERWRAVMAASQRPS
jgi:hypothetical protein